MAPDALLLLSGWHAVPTWLTLTWDIIRASFRAVVFWGLLLGVLGLLAAVALFFVLRAVKGYRWGW
jgi:hypothetical protein